MTTPETNRKTYDWIRNSATIKMITIGVLILVLLIPAMMVSSLIRERQSRKESVIREISQKWGFAQTITGPFFTVPYKTMHTNEKGITTQHIEHLHFLPETVNLNGTVEPHIRYRSLYEAVLYHSTITASGTFVLPDIGQFNIEPDDVMWDEAKFSIGITDMRGITENIIVRFNDKDYKATPGLATGDVACAGVQTTVPLANDNKTYAFSFDLNLNGSDELHLVPVGETTQVTLNSPWTSPSFNGAFLPTKRDITQDGFTADWTVLHLNRNYPQAWTKNTHRINNSSFGLKLIITTDLYQKTMRTSKYAMMFIVFTFSAFFFAEIINKKRVHPIQYLLIGVAVILFYVLLLSISEHLSFDWAYLMAAAAITIMITGYAKGILKNKAFTVTVCGILVLLYAYLYIVLQLEDYALLMGSVGLLVMLGTVMYVTRKIDWYHLDREQNI